MTELQEHAVKKEVKKEVKNINKKLKTKKVVFTLFEGGQCQIEVFLPQKLIFQVMCNNTIDARKELDSERFKGAINEK